MPPQIQEFTFGNEPANAGDLAIVQCAVAKGDAPINITWLFNDVLANSIPGVVITPMGSRVSSLTIESVGAHHRGHYNCLAANKAGSTNFTSYLTVNGNWRFYYLFIF